MNQIATTENLDVKNYPLGAMFYNVNFRCLYNEKGSIYLRHKLNQLLEILINNDGRIVAREELIEKIWKGNEYVGHKALTHSICKLRQYFSELGEDKIRIVTVPKSGYSLIRTDSLPAMIAVKNRNHSIIGI